MKDGCVFCDYSGPSPILEYWNWFGVGGVFVIEPIEPVTDGHVLVIPERHVEDALDDPILAGEVFRSAATWARGQWESVNLITSVGEAATQTVKHLHVHVVPRREDDGLALPWDNRVADALMREHEAGAAMFRAVADGRTLPEEQARAVLTVGMAEYVSKWMPKLHRGMTLDKSHELTLDGIAEMADGVLALAPRSDS